MATTDTQELDDEPVYFMPPLIVNNPRQRIEPEQIPLSEILLKSKKKRISFTIIKDSPLKTTQPQPLFPLELSCTPILMCFKIDQETITQHLRLWNICKRSIYLLCCGMWDETARLGASWSCQPHTKFLLPPGFMAKINIKAIPRGIAPIPYATTALQIAIAHKRDNVVGYIVIPICAKFLTYEPPVFGEGG